MQKINLFGGLYSVKPFLDRGEYVSLPYEVINGVEYPIILSSIAIIKHQENYLMVTEVDKGIEGRVDEGKFAFPGGKCELQESLIEAACRETKEETPFIVQLGDLVGVYKRINKRNRIIYKAAFRGNILMMHGEKRSPDVSSINFLSQKMIEESACEGRLKTSDILTIFQDYLNGIAYSLTEINSLNTIKNLI
jgi:ADP-ribose pyrophosphatase YjhB (NUDIX family)